MATQWVPASSLPPLLLPHLTATGASPSTSIPAIPFSVEGLWHRSQPLSWGWV